MKAVKAIYDKGKIELSEPLADEGPVEVLVVFPEASGDPWEPILNETALRPSFLKYAEECEELIKQGQAKPLDPRDL
jgi:hypothetical protein